MAAHKGSRGGDRWATVGKIGAVLAAIWIAVQLWDNYTGKRGLVAVGHRFDFVLPDDVKEGLSELGRLDAPWAADDSSLAALPEPAAKAVASYVSRKGLAAFGDGRIGTGMDTYAVIEVSNRGNSAVMDVVMDSPWKGVYSVTGTGSANRGGPFDGVVPLGTILPGREVVIRAWVASRFSLRRDVVTLTHPKGRTAVPFGRVIRGWPVWVMDHWYWFLGLMSGALVPLLWSGKNGGRAEPESARRGR